jgi:amino acid adenylation domain-containing protein
MNPTGKHQQVDGGASGLRATPLQRAMVLGSAGGGGLYHLQVDMEFPGRFSHEELRTAWDRIVDRNEVLRAGFRITEEELHYVVRPAGSFRVASGSRGADAAALAALRDERWRAPFDFAGDDPLWRVDWVRQDGGSWAWSLVIHHAVTDWRSLALLLRKYVAELSGDPESCRQREALPFSQYLEWHKAQDFRPLRSFWESRLAGLEGPTPLPLLPGFRQGAEAGRIVCPVDVPEPLVRKLRELGVACGVSMATILLGAWALYLSRATGERKVMFGVVRAGYRSGEVWRSVQGPMVNTLPLVLDADGARPVQDWLRMIRDEWQDSYQSEHCPGDMIRSWSGFPSSVPMYTTVVNLVRSGIAEEDRHLRVILPCRLKGMRQRTDVALSMTAELSDPFKLSVRANAEMVAPEVAEASARALGVILRRMVQDPSRLLRAIELVSPEERQSLLRAGTGHRVVMQQAAGADGRMQEGRRLWGDRPAIECGERVVTFRELHELVDRQAVMLRAAGVQPGQVVAVMVPVTPEMISMMLAVIRCGGVFCVIDSGHPQEMRDGLLRSISPDWVIADACGSDGYRYLLMAELAVEPGSPAVFAPHAVGGSDLLYLVCTSGSTGVPKVVQIEQRGALNLLDALRERYGLTPGDRRLQWARPGTDYFIAELLVNLAAGVCLVMPPAEVRRDLGAFVGFLRSGRITVVSTPGSFWHEWVHAAVRDAALRPPDTLRLCITGMEAISGAALREWMEVRGGGTDWINVYGPSETTMVCSSYSVPAGAVHGLSDVPIGDPVPNMAMHVLDREGQLLPEGFVGEIGVAGVGVMRGYLGADAGESVVANPFDEDGSMPRMYRTGDYGYRLPEGGMVFHGRRDQQVKIRGHRIELGMVETVLRQRLDCSNAVALAVKRGGREVLAAVLETESDPGVEAVRRAVAAHLPAPMVPALIWCMGRLPQTAAGKVDRRALTDLFPEEPGPVGPGDPLEAQLIGIWRRHLGASAGLASDFFAEGGDSLAAMEVVAAVSRVGGVRVHGADLYMAPTPAMMAARLSSLGSGQRFRFVAPVRPVELPARTLFVMNGWGGDQGSLARMADQLSPDDAVWGLYGSVVSDQELNDGGIEGVAAMYAREMLQAQPEGPFHLMGYSVGCVVAFAVARALAARGREIGRLTLLDGFPSGVPPKVLVHPFLRFRVGRLVVRAGCMARTVYKGARWRLRAGWRWILRIPEPAGRVQGRTIWAALRGLGASPVPAGRGRNPGRFAEAAMRYRPLPLRIPVLLVLSLAEKRIAEKRRGWRWLSCGSYREVTTLRTHRQLMELETLDEVAPLVFPDGAESGWSWWRRVGRRLSGRG